MPDKRHHRGPHPQDAELFARERWDDLRAAVSDLSWLLSRGYAQPSALKIVGDRYNLESRQRMAVMRCACTDRQLADRTARRVGLHTLAGKNLAIDGYNVLTTIEVALGGGVVLAARDGCYRDIASIHGTYRKVEETVPALELAGEVLANADVGRCVWFLDAPVSNSGRLKGIMDDVAEARRWAWEVRIIANPDVVLSSEAEAVVATADSVILDRCRLWVGLAGEVVRAKVPDACVIELGVSDRVQT